MTIKIRIAIIAGLVVTAGFYAVFAGVFSGSGEGPVSADSNGVSDTAQQITQQGNDNTTDEPANKPTGNASDSANAATISYSSTTAPPSERPTILPAAPKQAKIRQSTAIERVYYPASVPNDPGYTQSPWPLTLMNAPTAWDKATGDNATVIAVVDTGFAMNHEDLIDTWHVNSGENGFTAPGDRCWTGSPANKSNNNCDDDDNGYVDDWRGWDFYNVSNNPTAGQDNPYGAGVSHGTETAGLSGAKGNNGTGITTLNWNTKLMPLKVLSDNGPGYTSDVAAAIYYAVDNGADVINLSLGSNEPDSIVLAATNYAYANDVVVVAAAGNCGTGTGERCSSYPQGIISYPARNPHVIAVGAVDANGNRASFSSYGSALDVVAPGSGTIRSTTWTAQNGTSLYRSTVSGTSYSAPLVASLASLVQSVQSNASVDDITAYILGTAQKTGIADGVYSTNLGHGIVDADTAITVAQSNNGTAYTPQLFQIGSNIAANAYAPDVLMKTGCQTETPSAYCTIKFQQNLTKYERFLPYTASVNTHAGWVWSTSMLSGSQGWQVEAVQSGPLVND